MNFIRQNVSLNDYTTFRIGGKAKYFAEPRNTDELFCAIDFAKAHQMNICILGGGANMLFPDEDLDCTVICTTAMNNVWTEGEHITAECGAGVDAMCDIAAVCGLSGMEFAAGLPGSIGGAVYMNARCYGHEFADIVESVRFISIGENAVTEITHDDINYAYKHSIFMEMPDALILDVTLRLHSGDTDIIREQCEANRSDRRSKGQYDYPSAGCIFKNNYEIGIPAGKLIEDAGLKNTRIGGAVVYNRHGNFIINDGNAKANDVRNLVTHICRSLESKGYRLEPEIKILDCEGNTVKC